MRVTIFCLIGLAYSYLLYLLATWTPPGARNQEK